MCNKMSDVRLSNASPTVERVDARQPENVVSVCRALFGTPDRDETRRYAAALQQESAQDFMERYNFDPVTDRPLSPGNYEWEEDGDAPEFYRRPPHGSQRPRRAEADSPRDNNRQNGEGESRRTTTESTHQQGTNGSRKRQSGAAGSCSDESPRKRMRSDRDEDEDSDGAGSQTLSVCRPEDKEEVPLNVVPEH